MTTTLARPGIETWQSVAIPRLCVHGVISSMTYIRSSRPVAVAGFSGTSGTYDLCYQEAGAISNLVSSNQRQELLQSRSRGDKQGFTWLIVYYCFAR
jgi:hypothetical protein